MLVRYERLIKIDPMKKLLLILFGATFLTACIKNGAFDKFDVDNPIEITSPSPEAIMTKVSLSERQEVMAQGGNSFAFNCLRELSKLNPGNLILSPLSLQYALAMTANGACGETVREITAVLGFGDDTDAMNEYCNLLLNSFPALDQGVELMLTDAMMIRNDAVLQTSFQNTLASFYYAPVTFFSLYDKESTVNQLNEWVFRCTNGYINPFVELDDLGDNDIAYILNALYFKAPWSGGVNHSMFDSSLTQKAQPFYLKGGGKGAADYMVTSRHFPYLKQDGYEMLEIPYAGGKYAMYILLPEEKDGLDKMLSKLTGQSWAKDVAALTKEVNVCLYLPKFEAENRFELQEMLQSLGVRKAFDNRCAEFDAMFVRQETDQRFWISKVLQKARIGVNEWGTEAAAVTAVMMKDSGAGGKTMVFNADHPFIYLIAEKSTGIILFEGIFTGQS